MLEGNSRGLLRIGCTCKMNNRKQNGIGSACIYPSYNCVLLFVYIPLPPAKNKLCISFYNACLATSEIFFLFHRTPECTNGTNNKISPTLGLPRTAHGCTFCILVV